MAKKQPLTATTEKGRRAEDLALAHLQRQGMRLVIRNYRCRLGEVDLVMTHANSLVFIEVRSRTSSAFVNPKETVDWRKQRRIARVAGSFLKAHRAYANCPVRFDVVSVTQPNYAAKLEWIPGAFNVDESF